MTGERSPGRGRDCPGPCTDGQRFPHYCDGCKALVRSWLSDIDSACAILAFSADGYSKDTSYGKIRAGKGSTVAGSVSVPADVLLTIADMLTRWMMAERATYARSRRGKPASPITEACAWLSANLDAYMAKTWQGGGTEARRFFGSIHSIWRQSQRLASCSAESVIKPLPCPRGGCGRPALTWRPGGQVVKCSACGKMLTLDQYDDLVAVVLEAERQKAARGRRGGKELPVPVPGAEPGEPAEPARFSKAGRGRTGQRAARPDGPSRSPGMLFSEDRCDFTELLISQCDHCRENAVAGAAGAGGASGASARGSGGSAGSVSRTA